MSGSRSQHVRRARAAAAVLALLAAGCSTGEDLPASPVTSSTRPPDTATPTSAPPAPRPSSVTIALAGDIHFEGALADRLRDPATALAPAAVALEAADVAIVNLETSVGSGGRPEPGKRFTFSAGPAAFAALAAAGIDVASMANNHALDHGRARLPSTLRAARSAAEADPPLAVIGLGRDLDEAFRPAVTDVDGTLVATVAATVADRDPTADRTGQWAATADLGGTADALDPAHLLAAVQDADRAADVVVAYLHWGVQGERCPSTDQRSLAGRLVAAGADVVVGTHAHELQGDGRLGRGYVAYGLGNFAWYSPGPTGVLTLTVEPPRVPTGRARVVRSAWWPAAIGADGLATRVRGEAAARFAADREALRACAGLTR
ncbi:poly-gamma-glutamate synthesis protein (capsule biosynthesis protein) [Nocardioides alpinus]|uniref:Poly-gamma-glutamate biosynthesis protein n=1 Tax=Nocardioides alpinus TaxID=748909 RepID=A0A1I1B143_9ACTN|nr:CapA family protein [Nocardioides alpinus]PKH41393.1 poly-gamma-glutamate biosynthesis protein [Nocardioides alpinus]SFB43991.1 poly-gamma-glutamate synthesis protein (capsule biosynthesis protein) [Nocardioides alpinus]